MSGMPGERAPDRRPDHEVFDELAVGWALHALEPEDEALFAHHLPDCARCTRTVAETVDVMAAMATDLPGAEPSGSLRDRLREAVAGTPQVGRPGRREDRGTPRAATPGAGAGESTDAALRRLFDVGADDRTAAAPGGPSPAGTSPAPAGRVRPAWVRGTPVALVAAAVVAILGLGVWNVVLSSSRDEAVAVAEQRAEVVDELLRPGTTVMARMTDGAGAVRATLVSRDGGMAVVTEGMAVNDETNETYVLWGLQSGQPEALGTFDVGRSGLAVQTVGSGAGAGSYAEYAVSLEPGREPPAEPSEVVASGQVTS